MGQLLSGPVIDKESGDGWSKELGVVWGYSGMQGWRNRMEDAHLATGSLASAAAQPTVWGQDVGWGDTALFGVMDGHGGEQVANWCERYLPLEIARGPSDDPSRAVTDAFFRMDEMLSDPANLDELQTFSKGMMSSVNPDYVGCTAVVCCLRRDSIIVGNAGDSRAVLCRNGKAIDMSEDHKPNMPSERARIKRAGGAILEQHIGPHTHYRVNGNLNLSRSIGDLAYKQNASLRPQDQMICCTPDIRTFRRSPSDEFMIIACDGIWDVLSSQDAVDYVRPRLGNLFDLERRFGDRGIRMSSIVEGCLDHCLSPDLAQTAGLGGDNMTMVVVAFVGGQAPSSTERWLDTAGPALQGPSWLCPYR